MAALSDIMPEPCERFFIGGKTGSGKSVLAERICSQFPYVVVYDAKGMLGIDKHTRKRNGTWPGFKIVTTLSKLIKLANKEPKLIYKPTAAELRSDATINAFFEFIYKRGNCLAYVDELTSVTNRTQLPTYYHDCLVRGRELGVSMGASSQRPVGIPINILESSERYYIFKLKMPQDVKRMYSVTGLNVNFLDVPEWEFYYCTEDGERRGPLILNL